MTRRLSWLLLVSLLAYSVLACSGAEADDGRTTYGLKVVVQPQSGHPSSSCTQVGSASPSTLGHSVADDLWLETTAHTQQGSTWYDVRLVRDRTHAILGGWRFEEKMVREQHEIRTYVEDAHGGYQVRISGRFDHDALCVP